MRNVFLFIRRYSTFLFFLLLQGLSIYLIVHYQQFHRAMFSRQMNEITGAINNQYNKIDFLFSARKTTEEMAKQNAILLNRLKENFETPDTANLAHSDSVSIDTLSSHRKWLYREAKVISNEISGIFNTIGLHRGSLQGLRKDMGVVDINGHVVGKIVEVSDNYAVAMSLLNKNSITSAKLKNGGDLGSVVWDAKDPGLLTLNDIKQSAKVNKGDTVFTSNYSEFFPYGLIIGTIADVKPDKGSNNYLIHLKPAVNFSTLQYGYAIDNLQKEEFIKLMDKVKSKDN